MMPMTIMYVSLKSQFFKKILNRLRVIALLEEFSLKNISFCVKMAKLSNSRKASKMR